MDTLSAIGFLRLLLIIKKADFTLSALEVLGDPYIQTSKSRITASVFTCLFLYVLKVPNFLKQE
jgi:hypothetical protein